MKRVGAYEAKTHLSKLLGEVSRGHRIAITHRGVDLAVLMPAGSRSQEPVTETIARIKRMRAGRRLKGLSLKRLIAEGRR